MVPAYPLFVLLLATPGPQRAAVGLYAGEGVGGRGPMMLEKAFAAAPDVRLRPLTAGDVRDGRLADVRAIIMPGGDARREAVGLGPDGRAAVRRFVAGGGCYVGICAGCYLASAEYDWSLGLLPVTVVDRANWERGRATLRLDLTPAGREWFGLGDDRVDCLYHNGPVLRPVPGAGDALVPLAYYREEVVRKGAKPGLMTDTPAAVAARSGRGWAVGISPHPEQTAGLKDLIPAAVRWALSHPPAK